MHVEGLGLHVEGHSSRVRKLRSTVKSKGSEYKRLYVMFFIVLDLVHTGPDPYGHHINLKSLKTSMTLKSVIILQNLIKAYHRKSGKSKYDRKLTELDVETTRIRSRVNGVLKNEIFLFRRVAGLNRLTIAFVFSQQVPTKILRSLE